MYKPIELKIIDDRIGLTTIFERENLRTMSMMRIAE